MLAGLEGYSTEMVAVCIIISIVAAFAYVYRKRVKSEYTGGRLGGGILGKSPVVAKEKPKKQINPQGSKNDYLQLLSALVSLARKKKWLVIAPAVIEQEGAYTQLVALIVTPQKIIGVCGFGYGGTIVAGSGTQDWTQRVNDTEHKISSPIKTMDAARSILNKVCKKLSVEGRMLEIYGGYTHPHAKLQGAAAKTCYTAADLIAQLQTEAPDTAGNVQSKEIIEKLRTVVIKPEKPAKKK